MGKFFAGLLSGAISITADAFNNLSDAGSSFISMIGFKLSGRKPDPDHPFGHGRIEYISGLFVAVMIILMAYELIKDSIGKILHPELPKIQQSSCRYTRCFNWSKDIYVFLQQEYRQKDRECDHDSNGERQFI